MKRNRKGFSLVELIVVLVIMAIIAALCAPNISAYVQAAKVQNYQTVANNLADELQTQLPQSRYWNWDEVQRNAYGILCADAGRGVTLDTEKCTDNQKVYQITGASSDANAVFTVTLTYHDAVKTSQKVDIAVSCDGYAAVQSVQECNLVLKTNYTDASAYPMSNSSTEIIDKNGWKNLLNNRVKKYCGEDGWESAFKTEEYKDYNFGVPTSGAIEKDSNVVCINTTDYPANSITAITFMLQRYSISGPNGGHVNGEWHGSGVYTHEAVFPDVMVQNGIGTGSQYRACGKDDLNNVFVLVGIDESKDENWVKYYDVFDKSGYPYDYRKEELTEDQKNASKKYNEFYGDDLFYNGTSGNEFYKGALTSKQVIVKYKVLLRDITSATDQKNSRGWIAVGGTSNTEIYKDASGTYQGVSIKVDIPDYIENLNGNLEYDVNKTEQSSEKYYDIGANSINKFTFVSDTNGTYPKTYRDINGNEVVFSGNLNSDSIAVYYLDKGFQIKKNSDGQYYYTCEMTEILDADVFADKNYKLLSDSNGYYVSYDYRESKKKYIHDEKNGLSAGQWYQLHHDAG